MSAPLCKDCRHYRKGSSAFDDRCAKRQIVEEVALVRGDSPPLSYCYAMRAEQYCAHEGKWYEPSPSLQPV